MNPREPRLLLRALGGGKAHGCGWREVHERVPLAECAPRVRVVGGRARAHPVDKGGAVRRKLGVGELHSRCRLQARSFEEVTVQRPAFPKAQEGPTCCIWWCFLRAFQAGGTAPTKKPPIYSSVAHVQRPNGVVRRSRRFFTHDDLYVTPVKPSKVNLADLTPPGAPKARSRLSRGAGARAPLACRRHDAWLPGGVDERARGDGQVG